MRRLLLTGASGTLGYNLTRYIARFRPEVSICVAMRQPNRKLFDGFETVAIAQWDMVDAGRTAELVREFAPDTIVHCAAGGVRPSDDDFFDVVKCNVDSTVELFRESCRLERCHFVHVSTGLVYRDQGRPLRETDPIDTLHPYGASKAAADTLLRSMAHRLGRHLTVVRPFSFTGIHDGGSRLFPSILRCAAERRPFSMSSGKQVRDFCAVQDVVSAIDRVLQTADASGVDVFNIGSGNRVTLRDLVEDVIAQLGIDVEVDFGKGSPRAPEPMHLVADTRRAQSKLGWRPRTSLVRAVWELGTSLYPELPLREPTGMKWQFAVASI